MPKYRVGAYYRVYNEMEIYASSEEEAWEISGPTLQDAMLEKVGCVEPDGHFVEEIDSEKSERLRKLLQLHSFRRM